MRERSHRGAWGLVALVALVVLALHLVVGDGYGMFRDELYYLVCADHLAWGYVDHPPLSIAVLALWRALVGDAPAALRVLPAILHVGSVAATALLARRMGARGVGLVLAAVCTAFAPGLLGLTSVYSMNAIDLAAWTAAALVFVEVLAHGRTRDWLALGLIVGLGLLNKYSMLWLASGMVVGILFAPRRAALLTWRPWAAMAITLALFAPHLVWQVAHDWPTREFVANAQRSKMIALAPAEFLSQVWMDMNPATVLVWLPGLFALLLARSFRKAQPLGVAFVVVMMVLLAARSKPYYADAAFPIVFAAGAVVWERFARTRPGRGALAVVFALVLGVGALSAPFALPLLPVPEFVAYAKRVGIEPESGENHEMGVLPQHFADRFGWPEMAQEVARVHDALPETDRARCRIVASNYGEAGALRYFGPALGLPDAVSQHNNFYLWGPGTTEFDVVIAIGYGREGLLEVFSSVEEAGRTDHPYAMPYERNLPIHVCRGPRLSLDEAWERGRHFM